MFNFLYKHVYFSNYFLSYIVIIILSSLDNIKSNAPSHHTRELDKRWESASLTEVSLIT